MTEFTRKPLFIRATTTSTSSFWNGSRTVNVPADAILTEDGDPILTEDDDYLLVEA